MAKQKTFYMLRVRMSSTEQWSEPEQFLTRRARNAAASFARVIGGIHTHSYEERRAVAEEASTNARGATPSVSA